MKVRHSRNASLLQDRSKPRSHPNSNSHSHSRYVASHAGRPIPSQIPTHFSHTSILLNSPLHFPVPPNCLGKARQPAGSMYRNLHSWSSRRVKKARAERGRGRGRKKRTSGRSSRSLGRILKERKAKSSEKANRGQDPTRAETAASKGPPPASSSVAANTPASANSSPKTKAHPNPNTSKIKELLGKKWCRSTAST